MATSSLTDMAQTIRKEHGMRIEYSGNRSKWWKKGTRHAEIFYEEHEEEKADRVIEKLRGMGWQIDNSVAGWAGCEVIDKDEFEEFKEDWKEAKSLVIHGK